MRTVAKIATGLSAAVVAGLVAFAVAPAIAGQPSDVSSSDVSSSADSTAPEGYVDVGHGTSIPAGGPDGCKASAYIWIGSENDGPMRAAMEGAELVDMGPREFATGEVHLDDNGRPATYTVAPGDVLTRIGDRFCIYNGGMLSILNNYPGGATIQPGDVITLNADLITDYVYPHALD
ncbi:MAG: LysM peptidoglycan-binding domain-containing protein [Brevibacterium sp.]